MSSSHAARPLLWPLVPIYRLGLALRELQFRLGFKPVRRLKWPVVSIGNLSAGGAGKTPLTIALANALTARGVHVDVLSRGYGRRSTLPLLVDPAGKPEEFGDEPLLIAREANVPVYVAAERYEAGMLAERSARAQPQAPQDAEENPRLRAHILDDGFQHRQLARDIDILLLDGTEWSTEHLLPAGNLREPFSVLRRATVVAVTAPSGPPLEKWLRSNGRWQGPIWRLRRLMEIPQLGGPVAAFCGIARPDQFFQGLESAGVKLVSQTAFADHHNYTAADLARVESAARAAGATELLTTEKDRVRIGALAATVTASLPIQTVPLRVEIEDERAAIDWLIHSLKDPA
jgi:tetraacyldisaccharide 4'-kinase